MTFRFGYNTSLERATLYGMRLRLAASSIEYPQGHVGVSRTRVGIAAKKWRTPLTQLAADFEFRQDLRSVRDYYCSRRSVGNGEMSIYDIWENGGAFNDSVTPSTYCNEYRSHLVAKLLSLAKEGAEVFSIGCGNAFVEGDVGRQGRIVKGIDCNEEAVVLAQRKGVEAFALDYFALSPDAIASTDVIYADGLIGHLFDPRQGVAPFLEKLKALKPRSGTRILLSNDAPRDASAAFAPHERVRDFWFVAKDYLEDALAQYAFETIESYYFGYSRPLSGMRNRTICIARAP